MFYRLPSGNDGTFELEGNFRHKSQLAHLVDEETETVKSACFLRPLRERVVKLDMLAVVQNSCLVSTHSLLKE